MILRSHLNKLGFKPVTRRLKRMRGELLAKQFPQYDREVLLKYSETATMYNFWTQSTFDSE